MSSIPGITSADAAGHEAPGAWGEPGRGPDLYARLSALDRPGSTPRERAAGFLDAVVQSLGCLAATASLGVGGDEVDVRHTADRDDLARWVGVLEQAALEARSHSRSIARLFGRDGGMPEFAVVACPIDSAGRDPFGGVAVLIRCEEIPEAERIQLHLRSACLHAAAALSKPAAARRDGVEMSDIARVYTRAGQFKNLAEFAYAITNAARQRFNCDQAAMGRVSGGRIRLLCISGLDHIKARSPGVHLIEQAMGECADAGRPVLAQPADSWGESEAAESGKLHERWRAQTGGACVLSLPVFAGDEVAAIVSFRRSPDQPFDADDIDAVQKLLSPLAGAVPLVSRSTRSLAVHAVHSGRAAARWALSKNALRRKALILSGIAGLTWLAIAPSTFRVAAPAAVVASSERIVASPADGLISAVLVRAGDRVEAGAPLARMDTTTLQLERRELLAEREAAELRLLNAVNAGEPGEAAIARAERAALATRLAAVEERMMRAEIRAPIGGIVVGSGISDLPGRRVAVGDPMLAIAEGGAMSLEIRVPESRVAVLEPGSRVRFASHARPESPGMTTLDRVAPAAVQRNGKQVFIAEADLPPELDWIRPGMEGVAMVEVGERPNWWLATHRIADAARLRIWTE